MGKRFLLLVAAMIAVTVAGAQSISSGKYHTIKTYKCPEATQGVAVDDDCFYAIGNQVIARYDKASGKRLSIWKESDRELICHFDGGIIVDGLLYCSHSNFPEVPMASSIEVFDPNTLEHVKTISLGIESGSCTWIVRGEGCWYLGFAHYDHSGHGAGGETLKDNSWTQIVQYDDNWRRAQGWILPKALIEKLHPNSISGCLYSDGRFYCTGHDATELFVLSFPPYGMRLSLTDTISIPFHGQGIALDSDGNLWGIDRKSKCIIKAAHER